MKFTRALSALALAALAACNDSNSPNGAASGTVAFTFTGGGGGSFNVTGAIPVNQATLFTTAWAAGARNDANASIEILSVRPQAGGTFDEVVVTIPRQTAGSETFDCTAATCGEFFFLLGTNMSGSQFNYLCSLETGTVTIASITASRVTGSFGGSGTCENGSGGTSAFTLTGGSFDVPLVSDPGI